MNGSNKLSTDRRAFLRIAGLGLSLPLVGAPSLLAQEDHQHGGTPEAGVDYVGSDPESPSTGDVVPVAVGEAEFQLYDPVLPAVKPGNKDIVVVAMDGTRLIAKDTLYAGWTFDGTIPGRVLRVVEGDTVNATFRIDPAASTMHSLDYHSAKTPPDVSYASISPGEELTFSFVAKHPGAYMYHCGTPPILLHIGAGMYGAMIVDPKEGWPEPAQEFCLVQSEFYVKDAEDGSGVKVPDMLKMMGNGDMDYVTFNGYANQYVENPIKVRVGELIRIFVVNCGPNVWSSFHVVGTIFRNGYINASPKNQLFDLQSITVGPGDGACVEFIIDEPGTYPFVNHAFGHAGHGVVGLLLAE